MLYRLCERWGGEWIHPDHLSQAMTDRQLQGWMNFYQLEPFGGFADDFRSANAAWHLLHPRTQKRIRAIDLMPQWIPKEPPTPDEYKLKAQAAYARANAALAKA
jgi:Zn-dependent protease with chaperone function